jgi:hypothetical protein
MLHGVSLHEYASAGIEDGWDGHKGAF